MTRLASASSILCAGGMSAVNVSFANIVTTATYLRSFSNPNPWANNSSDYFAMGVATNGTHVLVSAYGEAESAAQNYSGKAYVFAAANSTLLYTLKNPNAWDQAGGDYFGFPLAMDGNTMVVAATYEGDANTGAQSGLSGKVYIYNMSTFASPPTTINTTNVATLNNPNQKGTSYFDMFGKSIGIAGGRIVVGSNESGNTVDDYAGRAYVYNTSGGLLYTLRDPNPYGTANLDSFGGVVAISNNYVAAAATGELDAGATNYSGKVYIFAANTGTLLYTLNNPNVYGTSNADSFGYTLTVTDTHLAATAYNEDSAAGTNTRVVYLYDVSTLPTAPATISSPTYTLLNPASSPSLNDLFGFSMDMQDNILAVGAYGAGGTGAVYLYDVRNMAVANGSILPTTTVGPPPGESFIGYSISLSGNTMAVGVLGGPSAALYSLS